MKYYRPTEAFITVTQVWKVQVAAQRYFNKAMEEVKTKLQPERECFWKQSLTRLDGYQADLVGFALDDGLDCSYPDW